VGADERAHVLVLPSEEYLPPREFGAGIFQKHQIEALGEIDRFRLGVISVRLQYSVPMYGRAIAFALAGRKVDNALGALSPMALVADGWRRLRSPRSFIEVETGRSYPVMRATGLYLAPPSPRLDPLWWVRTGLTAFETYCERFGRPHLIHAHNTLNAGLLAHRVRQRTGIPYVLTEHSSHYRRGLVPGALKGQVAAAMRGATAVLAVSDALRNSLFDWLSEKHRAGNSIDVLPNVLPGEFDRSDTRAELQPGQPFTFLAVGNLLPVKGHDVLVRAFALLVERYPGCRLRLIGEGPLRDELEQLARELGVAERMELLGVRKPVVVRQEMLRSHALVVSSHVETFGVVVIEALSCGLPVVATRCGGPEGLLTTENGVMAESGNPVSLSRAMARMVETRQRFDASAIQRAAIERFGRIAFAGRLARIYEAAADVAHIGSRFA
jgi:glycosyltransferase involved in cell wall biosynthesis